jgi:hypothetical protein
MAGKLSDFFSIHRRYARSVNLERDRDRADAVRGYILTERSRQALQRILLGATARRTAHAFTLTSVYGTGKSSFAQFLSCLCAPVGSEAQALALDIARSALPQSDLDTLVGCLPKRGFFRAIATARREPLCHTLLRALSNGADRFWRSGKEPVVARRILDLTCEAETGRTMDAQGVLALVEEILRVVQGPVLLLLDELGKSLEFAAMHQGTEDLYLLQQLAELQPPKGQTFYLVGMLHQSFADYGDRLATVQRHEWAKIQGRYEDIAFGGQPRQMMRLVGQAIQAEIPDALRPSVQRQAQAWCDRLTQHGISDLSAELLAANFPLHPVTALVLPVLCANYAQSDRSLFAFLTSAEPFAFQQYLRSTPWEDGHLPLLQLDWLYDYFIEAMGAGLAARPHLHRWVEIHNLIANARSLQPEAQAFLKTVGMLNLIDTTGELRAAPDLVTLALCDRPDDTARQVETGCLIEDFYQRRGILNYRKQADELQLWEGTDFNIEMELATAIERQRSPLAATLTTAFPLKPVVAQRHSYRTGTVRYFERRFLDSSTVWDKLHCASHCDGAIGYWVDEAPPQAVPATTADGKPLIVLQGVHLPLLAIAAAEYAALQILARRPELDGDAVARREVRYRLMRAEQVLTDRLAVSFALAGEPDATLTCWVGGVTEQIAHARALNGLLSQVCDRAYHATPILWNELLNRREFSAQGTKALRLLIDAMLSHATEERLGLQGHGPETSMYASLLQETGIHRQEDGLWGFYPPNDKSLQPVWQAIEQFCLDASDRPIGLDRLYQTLEAPPYGLKRGLIPPLLAAVLLYRSDDVSVHRDGTFIPSLGTEHFELLVKQPQRFAVKHFAILGLRSQVFRELETVLAAKKTMPDGLRNRTLLAVVKPLFQFVKRLPAYTKKTQRLSPEARAVIEALQQAQEPDALLFAALPQACGLSAIATGVAEQFASDDTDDGDLAKEYKARLVRALQEIQTAYDTLLTHCTELLHNAFGVRGGAAQLREDLLVRASYLTDGCLERSLRRFVLAAADGSADDKTWLEALLMVVADKPAESWGDDDVQRFEYKLGDLARRFANLEAIQKGMAAANHTGLEARRVSVTRPDGREAHRLVWLDPQESQKIDALVAEILDRHELANSDRLRQGLAATLAEVILAAPTETAKEPRDSGRQSRKLS